MMDTQRQLDELQQAAEYALAIQRRMNTQQAGQALEDIGSGMNDLMSVMAAALYRHSPEYRAIADHTIEEIGKLMDEFTRTPPSA